MAEWQSQIDGETQKRVKSVIKGLASVGLIKQEGDSTYSIIDDAKFRELIFGVWGLNLGHERMKHIAEDTNHENPQEFYSLVGLDGKTFLAFSHNEPSSLQLKAPFDEHFFGGFSGGHPTFCMAKIKLHTGIAQGFMSNSLRLVPSQDYQCPGDAQKPNASCTECKTKKMPEHLFNHLNDNIGTIFGGQTISLSLSPEIFGTFLRGFDDFYTEWPIEELVNNLLAVYWGIKYECTHYAGSDLTEKPLLKNEIDVNLMKEVASSKRRFMIELTTTADAGKLHSKYLPDKLRNFHSISNQVSDDQMHMVCFSLVLQKQVDGHPETFSHVSTREDIKLIGMLDDMEVMTSTGWPARGFQQLRSIFNRFVQETEVKIDKVFLS